MPQPRLPGSGVEKILVSEEFVGEAIPNFFTFRVEGCDKGLCFLCCTYWPLCLDGDDRGIGRGCFRSSCSLVWAISGDVSFLVAAEAKSTLNPLSFFFVCESGSGPSSPYVHGVWVSIVERVPPLEFCCSSSSFSPFDPFLQLDILLLMVSCCACPVVPCYWMVEFYAVGHYFVGYGLLE